MNSLLVLKTNMRLPLEMNEANAFGARDKITRLSLKMNTFSSKDGMHLTLKANVFGGRDELTCLAIKTNMLGTRDQRIWRWR